jgi:hypothetical protein
MDLKLTEKSVVITEVASNIGRATALKLAEESAELKAYKTSCNFTFMTISNMTYRLSLPNLSKTR